MGSVASRFSHGVRDAMRACSGKRLRHRRDKDEEEARLSTYESEPLDRAWATMSVEGGHERAVSVSRTGSRSSSLARLHDGKADVVVPCGRLASVSPRPGHRASPRPSGNLHPPHYHHHQQQQQDPHPGVSYQRLLSCADCNSTGINASLSPCCCRKSRPWVVDQGSQTTGLRCQDSTTEDITYTLEPVLSKEYIVRTYSIQNATPSPSPSTQSKFPSPDADTPLGPKGRLSHVPEWTPSPPSTLQVNAYKC
ncbi:hypothetical protein PoB_002345800 [Plakobranchus ocellatus]|uniref:Uncharacterized protein n=1 Tax=Plakobranchus ocellatus TaxID=259542 RepID=A0AAV3ZR53_9GAST|nr:hypothetical protein PoB_002345800 [Plakobranchus ocellatus]